MKLNTQCPHCEDWFFSRKARHHHQMTVHRPLSEEGKQAAADRLRNRAAKAARNKAEAIALREQLKKAA